MEPLKGHLTASVRGNALHLTIVVWQVYLSGTLPQQEDATATSPAKSGNRRGFVQLHLPLVWSIFEKHYGDKATENKGACNRVSHIR
jgi:hypothetical protein